MSDLAASFGVTASSATQIITDLEGRGFVVRVMDPQDRRVVRVDLTKAGREAMMDSRNPYSERMTGLAQHLGEEKCTTLIGLLNEAETYLLQFGPPQEDCGPRGPNFDKENSN